MSLRMVSAYSNDKGSDLFGSGIDDLGNDFFDEYLIFSPSNEGPDFPDLSESTHQERSVSSSESADTSTSTASQDDKLEAFTSDDCQSRLFSFIQDAPVSNDISITSTRGHPDSTSKASISDNELLSLEGITLQSPLVPDSFKDSIPASPTPIRRRNRLVDSISKSLSKATGKSARSPIRKTSASPIMMCSSRYSNSDIDVWGQRLTLDPNKFNFEYPQQNGPLSPPPSARVSSASENSMMSTCGEHSDGFSYNNPFSTQFTMSKSADYHTPLATPTLEGHNSRRTSFQPSPDTMLYPTTPQFHSSSTWTQEPNTSEYSTYGSSNSFVAVSDAPTVWWSHASTAPMAQPSPTVFHSNPQRATKSLAAQLQNELAYNANELALSHSNMANGLMISMPEETHTPQSFVVSSPSIAQPPSYFTEAQNQPQQFQTPTRRFSHAPTRQQYFSSPSIGHNRTRSTGSDSPSPKSATSPAFHIRKRRTPSRKANEPRTPSLGGAVDFVNFTPNDSKKILTGVAPSGSSKTKARREKEALDKRRRLSQAAVRAVRAAGGSVESLVEEGLFV